MKLTHLILAAVLSIAAGASAQSTAFDVQVDLGDLSTSGYYVAAVTPPAANVAPTGSGNLNPTMALVMGKRYKYVYTDAGNHPFSILAKGADPNGSQDVVLLDLLGAGSFEGDSGVDWVEEANGGGKNFYFTLTANLVSAMNTSGHTPGYRCQFHPNVMRGAITTSSGISDWGHYTASASSAAKP